MNKRIRSPRLTPRDVSFSRPSSLWFSFGGAKLLSARKSGFEMSSFSFPESCFFCFFFATSYSRVHENKALLKSTLSPAFARPQATSKPQEDQKRDLTTRSGCTGGLWCAQAAAASARQAERCAVPAAAPLRESGPATNTTNTEVVAGALTSGVFWHGFQRRLCSRSRPAPREPYPAHVHRCWETCQ